ncbi:hypothetical protein LWI28_001093 [Acer negundo]|uniref:Spindle pole body-associated protein Vik1/Cik1 microtubule binding domain-containing protein n=1 Tax=Acer negundo TaxID=4023 RepID=A0AAD5II31_ACENE|nr:hypothetical protein LWI28_001093 [Acer negundo]
MLPHLPIKPQTELTAANDKLKEAKILRKKFHNIIMRLKGNIRVMCRVRPLLPHDGLGHKMCLEKYQSLYRVPWMAIRHQYWNLIFPQQYRLGGLVQSSDGSKESLTVRYNNLRHEAHKYVDEGCKSLDIYNVAMGALQEAANKVAVAENNGGKVAVLNTTCGEHHKLHKNQTNTTSEDKRWCSQQPASEVSRFPSH